MNVARNEEETKSYIPTMTHLDQNRESNKCIAKVCALRLGAEHQPVEPMGVAPTRNIWIQESLEDGARRLWEMGRQRP